MRSWAKRIAVFVLMSSFYVALQAGSCTGDDPAGPGSLNGDVYVGLLLVNGDHQEFGQAIHMFKAGETFPCCRVESFSSRITTVNGQPGSKVTFQVGRNGSILRSVQCTIPSSSPANAEVRWTPTSFGSNTGTLTCTGWTGG